MTAKKGLVDLFADELVQGGRRAVAAAGAKVIRRVQVEVGQLAGGLEKEAACSCDPRAEVVTGRTGRKASRLVHEVGCPAFAVAGEDE